MEFVIVRFTKRNGDIATRLINLENWKETENKYDFFEPGCEGIENVGIIQITGEIDWLDDQYISE